ncbi:hypothetical protein LLEC1_02188 [Akanthomyces lecanii]|uniref:CC domain-containing protein n=1 Tax=Cordyceps confragosa TaxID=2714763 RepID=A0A179IPH4_CORDF|nr:hypothetical protein LLEC1_02188 [Akanthomyces lecanii]
MKYSIIASIVSGAGLVATAAVAAPSSATCVPYNGVCFLGGKDYGPCCDDGICAGSRCRNPKTLTSAQPTATSQPTCVPYNGMYPPS